MDDSIVLTIVVIVGFLAVFFLILLCVCISAPHKIRRKKRKRRKKFRRRGHNLRNEDTEYNGNEDNGSDLQMNCNLGGRNSNYDGGDDLERGEFRDASDLGSGGE